MTPSQHPIPENPQLEATARVLGLPENVPLHQRPKPERDQIMRASITLSVEQLRFNKTRTT